MTNTLRIAHILERSQANGPGERFVAWTQGCTLACAGCINRSWSWAAESQEMRNLTPPELLAMIPPDVTGVSLSGGEPMQQHPETLRRFLQLCRLRGLSTLMFSGYSLEEIRQHPERRLALLYLDVLVAGRFELGKRVQDQPLIGSTNQQVHFISKRYSVADLERVVPMEIKINMDTGTSVKTGITS